MKLLFDLFPVFLFFVAYRFGGIYVATGVAMAATVLQIGWAWFVHRKVDPMMWFTLVVVMLFGGLTLILHNPTFIKWKPSIIYWGMAVSMAVAMFGFGKNAIRSMLGSQIDLPAKVWRSLNLSWMAFFTLMGAVNIFVAYQFSEETWVNFKMFGGIGLMVFFVLVQSIFLSRHMEQEKD